MYVPLRVVKFCYNSSLSSTTNINTRVFIKTEETFQGLSTLSLIHTQNVEGCKAPTKKVMWQLLRDTIAFLNLFALGPDPLNEIVQWNFANLDHRQTNLSARGRVLVHLL